MSKRGRIPKPISVPCAGGSIELRVPEWADFEDWVTLRRNNRNFLQPWEPTWKDEHLNRHSYKTRLTQFKNMISQDESYPFHVFRCDNNNQLVGACNLTSVRRGSLQIRPDRLLGRTGLCPQRLCPCLGACRAAFCL